MLIDGIAQMHVWLCSVPYTEQNQHSQGMANNHDIDGTTVCMSHALCRSVSSTQRDPDYQRILTQSNTTQQLGCVMHGSSMLVGLPCAGRGLYRVQDSVSASCSMWRACARGAEHGEVLPRFLHVTSTQLPVAKAAPRQISVCAARTASCQPNCSTFTTHTSTHTHTHTPFSRHQQMG
jgi:hypothetical protein